MEIDWSKAPEGFPLWLEGIILSQKIYNGWYRAAGEVFIGAEGGQWRANREGEFFIVHRNPDDECAHSEANRLGCPECGADFSRPRYIPPAWTGEGLPPVGMVCEYQCGYVEQPYQHAECKVIAHFVSESGKTLAAFTYVAHDGVVQLGRGTAELFRPIRTAEQIKAEARDKAAKDLYETIRPGKAWEVAHGLTREGVYRAIDAGYGKLVEL